MTARSAEFNAGYAKCMQDTKDWQDIIRNEKASIESGILRFAAEQQLCPDCRKIILRLATDR